MKIGYYHIDSFIIHSYTAIMTWPKSWFPCRYEVPYISYKLSNTYYNVFYFHSINKPTLRLLYVSLYYIPFSISFYYSILKKKILSCHLWKLISFVYSFFIFPCWWQPSGKIKIKIIWWWWDQLSLNRVVLLYHFT